MDYEKIYHQAYNGMTDILNDFDYPNMCSEILERIAELQIELEEIFITYKE